MQQFRVLRGAECPMSQRSFVSNRSRTVDIRDLCLRFISGDQQHCARAELNVRGENGRGIAKSE